MEVPATGGVAVLRTSSGGRNEVHAFPSFLSDQRHFFYLRAAENPGIYLGSLDVKPEEQSSQRVVSTSLMAVYVASSEAGMSRLLFLREGSLLAQPFDEKKLELVGEPVPVAEQVGSMFLSGKYSVSSSGLLAYRTGKTALWLSRLTWFDRQGKKQGDAEEPGTYSNPTLPSRRMERAAPVSPRASFSFAGSDVKPS